SLDFLKDPLAQEALFTPQGIKNLQKLTQLPKEQKLWWNRLALAHCAQYPEDPEGSFDFNHFFEAYTQVFVPRITELHLRLPLECPITYQGHMLVTLNRVLDVITQASNPQEQIRTLDGLDWSATGCHFAMTQGAYQH